MTPYEQRVIDWLSSGDTAKVDQADTMIKAGVWPAPADYVPPEARPRSFPSLWRQAVNLARTAVAVVADAAKGKPVLASDELVAARLLVCFPCQERVDGRCSGCGCNLSAKARVLSGEGCPLRIWPKGLP